MAIALSNGEFVGYMIYGIPSWILYLLIVAILIKPSNKKYFSASYFKLALAIGITIWEYAFLICLICATITAGSLTWYYWISDINITATDANNGGYGMSPKLALFPTNSALKLASFGLTSASADLIVNTITCFAIVYNRKHNNIMNKAAWSLMIITLIEFVAQMLVFFAEGTMYLLMQQNLYNEMFINVYFAMCWITDLSVLSKPYSLLLMSRNVRNGFLQTYYSKNFKNSNRIITTTKPVRTISNNQANHSQVHNCQIQIT